LDFIMIYFQILTLVTAVMALPSPQLDLMGEKTTRIFGSGPATAPPALSLGALGGLAGVAGMDKDTSGGSGPYTASYGPVPGLPRHTIYQTKTVPPGEKLPVIVWGNGACSGWGGWFAKFLNEIASHGFVVIANGAPEGDLISGMVAGSKGTDLIDAVDWIDKNAGSEQWAHSDKTRIAAAGQSCGGVQAYSASLDPRVKLTGIFNSGLISAGNTKLFDKLHGPVGFFLGGPTDIAYENVSVSGRGLDDADVKFQ
jgi:dienelactone hydrolase